MHKKSKALTAFKSYKALVEKEAGISIKVLRTDRSGEYNSEEFGDFCEARNTKAADCSLYTITKWCL